MDIAALILAAIALLVAFSAKAAAGGAGRTLDEGNRDLKDRLDELEQELKSDANVTRQLLAQISDGASPTREMIMEGQLWADVSPEDGKQMVEGADPRIIDVRTPQETAEGIIPGAILIPIEQIESRHAEIPNDGRTTLIYCAAGGRSAAACGFLIDKGYSNLHNLEGGMSAWPGEVGKPGA